MLKSKRRWNIQQPNNEVVEDLAKSLNIPPLIASLLINRGMTTKESASQFLNIENQSFHDPFLLDGMDRAVERIHKAIENNEKIMIYGDYDADGVTSTSVMLTALQQLGADVDFYIPNRFSEGYGPNEEAFRFIDEQGYTLVITVDTGISAVHEAQVAEELAFDLIITDHHEPGPVLPSCYAILHPKKPGSHYPFGHLAGVGVAFKLAHALLGEVPEHLLELAVIGTIADLVPLTGENRLIAKKGLKRLAYSQRPGLKALFKVCNVKQQELTEDSIGFALAPRINAVGRLQDADPAVELIMSQNEEEALLLAEEIDRLNKERQALVNEITEEAIRKVEETYPPSENAVLVITGEGWNAGVIGIVASRLVDRFYRPTIVLSEDHEKGVAKGSARSIAGFDLFANLSTCREILPHFGGHPMAAGMTLKLEDVAELRERLNQLAKEVLSDEDFIPVTSIDVSCKVEDVTIEAIEQLQLMAPFGMNNPKPKVAIAPSAIQSIRKIGADQTHMKLVIEDNGQALDAIGFGFGYLYEDISPLAEISLMGELNINEWNNIRKPQLMIEDMAVNDWQLFDLRGLRDPARFFQSTYHEKMTLLAFSEETLTHAALQPYRDQIVLVQHADEAKQVHVENETIVLLDLPTSSELIEGLFAGRVPARIYAIFFTAENHFFDTIPTREHFKWYYAFLTKKSPFDLKRYKEELAIYKGWTKDTIDFMSQVFFELEFVTIENGLISLVKNSPKRDLIESVTFRHKQEHIQIEKNFLYTSYAHLKSVFEQVFKRASINEEATN